MHGLVNLNPDGKHSKIKNSKGSSVPGDANHFFVNYLPALSSDVSSTAIGPNDSMGKKRKKQGRHTFTKSSSSPCIDSPSIFFENEATNSIYAHDMVQLCIRSAVALSSTELFFST